MVNHVEIFANQLNIESFAHEKEIPSIFGTSSSWKLGIEARCCAFSEKDRRFAWSTGCGFKVICYGKKNSNYNTSNGNQSLLCDGSYVIDCGNEVRSMEFAPEFRIPDKNIRSTSLLAVGLNEGGIKIWNTDTGVLVFHLSDHQKCVTGLTFAPCGSPILLSCSYDKTLKVWDLEDDGNMSLTLKEHNFPVCDCAFSPTDKHLLASVGMGKTVLIWKLEHKRSGRVFHYLRGHKNDVVSCSWSPDGALLATASRDSTVFVWDPHLNQALFMLCHQFPMPTPIYAGGANGSWVTSVSFSKDGRKIATVCEDDRLRLWKIYSDDSMILETLLPKTGYQCRFSPDGKCLAVGKEDGSVTWISDFDNEEILPLTHLCRLAARKSLTSNIICNMHLPRTIKNFLLYRPPMD